ncbi:hypothetical protein POJ06DRAFT_265528 [Lipomyces tetrasporus]|uniref:RRM domain-containing protein n=1 Tax=Lipomyces tetrasporus TaxID=54092 RepID=A0AAD7QWA6_9ASCO|nr:uncharacterized protein POJ06DRAFT_265528 [Lipomyces tetrasporus]KAJ8102664.1 hypothetical protein POJ06DRAFT_265528 [Lipomyces tetrasporus]
MSLTDFLKDESYGSWADEMEDLPIAPGPPGDKSFAGSSFDRSSDRYNDRGDRGDRYGSGDRFDRPAREFDDKVRGSRFEKYEPREERSRDRPEREPLPIPDKPPYTAHIGNLAHEAAEDILTDYFSGLSIDSIRIMRDRMEQPKGFAYVEFSDRESLEQALDRTGGDILGRVIRVNVADPPKDDRTQGDWRSGRTSERRVVSDASDGKVRDFETWERRGPLPPLASEENRRRRSSAFSPSRSSSGSRSVRGQDEPPAESHRSFDNWRSGSSFEELKKSSTPSRSRDGSATPDSEDKPRPAERKRLNLKPRTQPVESEVPAPASVSSSKPNPFGGAAPVDTAKRLRELEAKMADREAHRPHPREQSEREREIVAKPAPAVSASRGGRRAPVTDRRPRTNNDSNEEKKEESPSTKQFDLLRRAATSDDFVPDEDDEDTGAVVESDIKIAPAPVEAAIAETAETASEATAKIAVEGDSEWSVVPKNKRATNGK